MVMEYNNMNKQLRTYSLLMALLTTASFTPLASFAAGTPAGAGIGIGGDEGTRAAYFAQRIFTYNAPESKEFKDAVFFPFQRNFEAFLGTFHTLGNDLIQLAAIPSETSYTFKRDTPSVESVLDERFATIETILSVQPSAVVAWKRFNTFYRAKAAPMIAMANALLVRAKALPVFDLITHQECPDPINIMWINPADDGAQQIALINDIEQFKKTVSRWEAENPVFDYRYHEPFYDFLAFYQNVDAVLSTGKFMPLNDYTINLWKALAGGGDVESSIDFFSASLGVRTITLYAPQNIVRGPGSYESTAREAETMRIDPSVVLAPPAPRLISTFTEEESRLFETINADIERILRAQRGGRGLAGYGVAAESIMDYGLRIAPSYEGPVQSLLAEQLRRRAVLVQSVETVPVSPPETRVWTEVVERDLHAWVSSLHLGLDTAAINASITYARSKAFDADGHNKKLLQALWNLRMMDQKYREASEDLRALWNVVLLQALNLTETHHGKCAQGARGRAVLIQKDMVQFMMDHDSKLPVGR